MTDKGPGEALIYGPEQTKSLRIGILHARWNTAIISSLVSGTKQALHEAGVPESNIITQSVPGSYELPPAAQRMLAASQTTTSGSLVSAATDLLGDAAASTGGAGSVVSTGAGGNAGEKGPGGAFDAVIAIGVLIKGSTMHFEYIADAVSHGLMRVQLDSGVPVVFGVLTCLNEEQARVRAGLAAGEKGDKVHYAEQGHNHGVDWGKAAVEMAVKKRAWGEGRFV